jgi:hypothetical protein
MLVLLGNSSAREAYRDADGTLRHRAIGGARVTSANVPDNYTLAEALSAIVSDDGVWANHAEPNAVPDWVESDNAELASEIASALGCPASRPIDWMEDY